MSTPLTALPHPQASRAVLVGVSEYTTLEGLPAVANNIAMLRQVITDADLWGLPDEHCVTLLNPTSVDEVLDTVHAAASAASDALLFYFAGHGLLDSRSDLFLALPGSDSDRLYRAVRYDDIRREVVDTARSCYGKVVLLDCCYSGRALQGGMSGSVDLADHARVDGTYLMTASAETSLALAPPGDDYTAFTGVLVDKLANGLPDGPELLDMETLFYHVRADLQARHYPVPQQRTRNDGKAIALVRNRHGMSRRTPVELADITERVLPRPPAGLETLLRYRPSDMYAEVQVLRVNGRAESAEQVLASSAALRADQEVAAIIDLLRRQGLAIDAKTVITTAAQRPPTEVLRIVEALHATDLPDDAARLVQAVGAGPVSDVASLAQLLQSSHLTGDLMRLLDTALDTAQAQSSLIGLVNALWMAGLREEVDGLIDRAVSKLSGPAALSLADELRAVGREEAAFGLYAASAQTLATYPPDEMAQLCHAMAEADYTDGSAQLAHAVIDRADDGEALLKVLSAFWDTNQDHHADRTLTRAATVLSNSDLLSMAHELRARDRDQDAYQLCLQATTARPAAIMEITTALREDGRPVDARNLLAEAVARAPMHTLCELVAKCADSDRQRVLETGVKRDPRYVAALLNELTLKHPITARQFVELIQKSAETRIQLLPIIVDRLDPRLKEETFAKLIDQCDSYEVASLLQTMPSEDAKLLMFLAVKAGNPQLASIIDNLPTASGSTGDPALSYLVDQPVARLATLVDGLHSAHFPQYAQAVLDRFAGSGQDDHTIARHVAYLFGADEPDTGIRLLNAVLQGRSNASLATIITALRQRRQPASLEAAAEWVKATHSRIGASNVDGILRQIGLSEYTTRTWLLRHRKSN